MILESGAETQIGHPDSHREWIKKSVRTFLSTPLEEKDRKIG